MRLHHPIRRARIATIAAAIVTLSVSAFGQTGQSRLSSIAPGGRRRPAAAAGRDAAAAVDRRGRQAGARAEPRHPDPALRPADSGHGDRAGAIVLGAAVQHDLLEELATSSRSSTSSRARSRASRPGSFSAASRSAETLPWGANYTANWNNSRFTTNDPTNTFNPRLQSNLALNFTQPLLRNRSIDQIRQQVASSRKFRDLSDIQLDSVIIQTTRSGAERVLGSLDDDQQPEGAAGIAGAGAAVAQGQPQARRDRHAGADRHRAGAGRGREQRGARDRRRGGDQAGAGQPARADSRLRRRRLLDHGRSSRATRRRSRNRRSTSTPRCATRSTSGRTCARRRTASSAATSTSAICATRSCPT